MTHLIDRYGMDEVTSWYFEFWNEPEEFFKLFKATYYVMKKISADLKVSQILRRFFCIKKVTIILIFCVGIKSDQGQLELQKSGMRLAKQSR